MITVLLYHGMLDDVVVSYSTNVVRNVVSSE